jgi:hypothetical protein
MENPFNLKDQRRVWVIAKIAGSWTRIKIIKITSLTTKVSVRIGPKKTETYLLDISKPAIRIKNRWIYLIDILHGQVGFSDTDFKIDSDMIDMAMTSPLIDKLVEGIEKPEIYAYLLYIVLGVVIGLLGGYVLGSKFPL